jgi:hypothetical protein
MPSSFSKTFIKTHNTMPDQNTDGLRALTHRDFGTKLKYLELRAAAIIAALSEPNAPKVRDVGPNQFVLTAKKAAHSVLVCYLVEDGQPVVQFVYDYKAQGLFEKVIQLLGSAVHDLADAAPAEVLEFTASTTQDCA